MTITAGTSHRRSRSSNGNDTTPRRVTAHGLRCRTAFDVLAAALRRFTSALITTGLFTASAFAAEGSFPSAVTSMSTADIDGAAPADDPARIARWQALREAIFGKREIRDGTSVIGLDVPVRALDAALVPLSLSIVGAKPVKSIYLVIDNNPSPLAGHILFGPAADTSSLKLRVRVNEYTLVHAVAETSDGSLYGVEKFVKAAGGCSAPAGSDEAEAIQQMGRMKLKVLGDFVPGKPLQGAAADPASELHRHADEPDHAYVHARTVRPHARGELWRLRRCCTWTRTSP